MRPIQEIAKKIGIDSQYLEPYGHYKAKISLDIKKTLPHKKGKYVLVTAITPTKAGEGKTTTSIALTDGLSKIEKNVLLTLREPSLGPVFGLKGGATGGGKVTVEPSEDINLHFNGDMHALTTTVNLIAAVLDNSIYQGNPLSIDPERVVWKRAIDMNERTLREIRIGIGEKNGVERKDGFVITVATELMAIFCLAKSEEDFLEKVNQILLAYRYDGTPVFVKDLKISHAIARLMHEAMKPNLVQTNEGNPCLIHGGPFANIAHGCNSLIAADLALSLADIVVTEAGFGADLGAEKFFDIACQEGGLHPDAAVLVATIRALKLHGGIPFEELENENVEAMLKGTENLKRHAENIKKFGVPFVIAINHFHSDSEKEIKALTKWCKEQGFVVSFLDGYEKGGDGAIDLANKVVECLETKPSNYHPLYEEKLSYEEKITKICKEIYRAKEVMLSETAKEKIHLVEEMGYPYLRVCMAKTPHSFSDQPTLLNAPKDFTITVRDITLSLGAGFIVCLTGDILTLPGLPKVPAAVKMEDQPLPWNSK